jgi:hypothetical protein
MEQINPKLNPQATLTRAYEKETCSKKTIVRLKVDYADFPPPKRITVEIFFDDGTSKIAEAVLVSAYTDYAYYDLSAADAREVYPYVNKIREIKVVGE